MHNSNQAPPLEAADLELSGLRNCTSVHLSTVDDSFLERLCIAIMRFLSVSLSLSRSFSPGTSIYTSISHTPHRTCVQEQTQIRAHADNLITGDPLYD